MLSWYIKPITKDEAIKLLGEDRFGEKSYDFYYTDRHSIEFNDGEGTIWELDSRTHWSDKYEMPKRWERHRGDVDQYCFTEWEEVD